MHRHSSDTPSIAGDAVTPVDGHGADWNGEGSCASVHRSCCVRFNAVIRLGANGVAHVCNGMGQCAHRSGASEKPFELASQSRRKGPFDLVVV